MAAPSYTTDLTLIADGDEASGWTNFSTNEQGSPSYQDSDYPYIQGLYAVTQTCSKSKTLGNLGYDNGTSITLPTDGAFFVWQAFSSPFAIDDYAGTSTTDAGMHVLIGNSTSNFGWWYVGGSDKTPNPYGGWQCHAVNTTVTADNTTGTHTADQVIGAGVALIAYPSKGEPHQVDVMRYGRGSAIFTNGDLSNGYCTFAGFAAQNDSQNNRWGLLQETAGGYLWQGEMSIGTSSTAADFRDSNTTIFIKWTPKVTTKFNTIEVYNSSTYLEWDGIAVQNLDTTTASRGNFHMTDPADVILSNCRFVDMDTFTFNATASNTVEIDSTTFQRYSIIYQNSAYFTTSIFTEPTSAIGIYADDMSQFDNNLFVSDGTGHAMELSTDHAGNSYTFNQNTFTGYASTSGSTGNEAIYNNSGGHVTINITGGGDTPSIRNGTGASTTINNSVTLTLNGIVSASEVRIYTSGTTTEVAGIENVTDDDGSGVTYKFEYTYNYAADTFVDIVVHNVRYEYYRINNYELSSTAASLPIEQTYDRNYDNPP